MAVNCRVLPVGYRTRATVTAKPVAWAGSPNVTYTGFSAERIARAMRRRTVILAASAVVILGIAGAVVLRATLFRSQLPPAERGRRIAQREGCFTCHGPGGIHGAPNPGSSAGVPDFGSDELRRASDDLIREWIRDGISGVRAKDEEWLKRREAALIEMPAFGDKVTTGEVDDLVAFVKSAGEINPPTTPLERRGYDRARELGCFGCHGPGGQLSPPNPGSLKGYIPSWDGEDFPQAVRGREEFDQWVEYGISDRFKDSPFANVYLERATIQMPAFTDHLRPGDLEALWAYIEWLRSQ